MDTPWTFANESLERTGGGITVALAVDQQVRHMITIDGGLNVVRRSVRVTGPFRG